MKNRNWKWVLCKFTRDFKNKIRTELQNGFYTKSVWISINKLKSMNNIDSGSTIYNVNLWFNLWIINMKFEFSFSVLLSANKFSIRNLSYRYIYFTILIFMLYFFLLKFWTIKLNKVRANNNFSIEVWSKLNFVQVSTPNVILNKIVKAK